MAIAAEKSSAALSPLLTFTSHLGALMTCYVFNLVLIRASRCLQGDILQHSIVSLILKKKKKPQQSEATI